MAIFDLFKKKEAKSQKASSVSSGETSSIKDALFGKIELEQFIVTLSKMAYLSSFKIEIDCKEIVALISIIYKLFG